MTEAARQDVVLSIRDPRLEAKLASKSIPYEYLEDVSPSAFNIEQCLGNQARTGEPITRSTVERYKLFLQGGIPLPAVGARLNNRQQLVIWSGNHRLTAYKEAGQNLNVYLIGNVPKHILTELMYTENSDHGLQPPPEELLRQAMHLHDGGMSKKQASQLLGVSESKLTEYSKDVEADRRAMENGIPIQEWRRRVDQAGNRRLILGVGTDEGFTALAKLTMAAGLSSDELKSIIPQMNSTQSATKQVELVSQLQDVYLDRIQGGGTDYQPKRGKKQTPGSNLLRLLTQFENSQGPEIVMQYFTPERAEQAVEKVDSAIAKLRAMRKALKEMQTDA